MSDLLADRRYPDNPTGRDYPTEFYMGSWGEEYGQRFRGYLRPPLSGDYTFTFGSDDGGEFWLSTGEDPANKVQLAGHRTKKSSGAAVTLQAGLRYYVEVLHKEGTGHDHVRLGWNRPDGVQDNPIPGKHLSPWRGPRGPQAPKIASAAAEIAVGGKEYRYTIGATGNPAPKITVKGLPTWLRFDGKDTISGTPTRGKVGLTTSTITVTATNRLGTDTQRFRIRVHKERESGPGPTRGLVGWWKFDEGRGTVARDSSGRGNHGKIIGGTRWARGGIGGALEFDGDDVVTTNLRGFNSDFTWAAWIKTVRPTGTIIGNAEVTWSGGAKSFYLLGGRPRVDVCGVSYVQGSAVVNDGRWHHMALTADFETLGTHDTVKIYVDGRLGAAKSDWNINRDEKNHRIRIGHVHVHGEYFTGLIDEVRVYKRTLSEAEEAVLHRTGAPVDSAPAPAAKKTEPEPPPGGDQPDTGKLKVTGLLGTYFSGSDFDRPVLRRLDPQVDFDWGGGSPHPRVPADDFSVRWEGFLLAPATGRYVFHVDSDDGFRMRFSGKLIVDRWGPNRVVAEESVRTNLVRGRFYPVRIEYMDARGAARVRLRWTGPGTTEPVPVSAQLLRPPPGYEKLPGPPLVK